MPSCDGSNCSACACDASLRRENERLREDNESLNERLCLLEKTLELEIESRAIKKVSAIKSELKDEVIEDLKEKIRPEVEAEVRENIKDEIRPEVEAELREKIKDEIRPEVEKEIKAKMVEKIFG